MDADIAAFFDRIDHARLMDVVAKRINDQRMLELPRQWRAAGVLDGGELAPTGYLNNTFLEPAGLPLTPRAAATLL